MNMQLGTVLRSPVPEHARAEREPPAALARAMVRVHDLHFVLDRLAAAGIRALAFKGPVLDADLRGDPFARDAADLDLLVRPAEIDAALAALAREGWEPAIAIHPLAWPTLRRWGCQVPLVRAGRTVLDLHWDLAPAWFSWRPDLDAMRARSRTVEVAGRPVPTLSRADALLHLCAHGARGHWAEASRVEDLARAVAALRSGDAELAIAEARRTGASRLLAVGAALAAEFHGVPFPAAGDGAANRLVRLYTDALRGRARLPSSTVGRMALHLRSRERIGDRVRVVAGLLHTPRPGEWGDPLPPAPARWARRFGNGLRGIFRPS